MIVLFSNIAVAHPFASGGGTQSSSEETDLTMVILGIVVAGVVTLMVSDILLDKNSDSSSVPLYGETEPIVEETGVNWNNLNSGEEEPLPLLAISVFPGENGKNLANYFSSLIDQGDMLYYQVYPSPVAFGSMESLQAAETGFSFLNCQWFIAADSTGLTLYTANSDSSAWLFGTIVQDSTTVRNASSSFMEFVVTSTEQNRR
jgi:hypothetical protein